MTKLFNLPLEKALNPAQTKPRTAVILVILALALVLRMGYAMAQDHTLPYTDGGSDSQWYLQTGYGLVTGAEFLHFPPPPLYLMFIGSAQALFGEASPAAIIAIRVLQVAMSVGICYFAYRTASLVGGERAGLLVAVVLAITPSFVIEPARITTETLYMCLVSGALWLYVSRIATLRERTLSLKVLAWVALFLGLATLTRAVTLLFPLGLALFLVLLVGWRRTWRGVVTLLVVYSAVVATWTVYTKVRWDRWVIASEQFNAMLYLGAAGYEDPFTADEQLEEDVPGLELIGSSLEQRQSAYVEGTATVVSADIGGYLLRRMSELASAYLQPHGIVYFEGESLRDLALHWLREDRTLAGLGALISGDAFVPKLALYLLHYAGLLAGLAGMWATRKQWRQTLPLIGFIAYTTLLHVFVLALPRYIFPTMMIWWLFAAVWLAPRFFPISQKG
jgi:4-amino-4-deoxy-L-arabinose transferase-like glycosyltransferase